MRKRRLWLGVALAGALAACGTPRPIAPPPVGQEPLAAPGGGGGIAGLPPDGEVYSNGNTYRLLATNELPIAAVTVDSAASGAPASNLDDGNLATAWSNGGYHNPTAWAAAQLSAPASLGSIAIKTGPSAAGTSYDVQVSSDGTTWTTVLANQTNTSWNLETKALPANTSGKYVRIFWHNSASAPQPHFAIYELVVNGVEGPAPSPTPTPTATPTPTPGPSATPTPVPTPQSSAGSPGQGPTPPPITGGTLQAVTATSVTADSNYPGTTPQLAVDGNLSTQWANGGYKNQGAYIELDYDQPHRFDHLDIKTGALPPGVTYDIEINPSGDGFFPITGQLTNTTWTMESKPLNMVASALRIVFYNNPNAPVGHFQVFEAKAYERVFPDNSVAVSPGQHQDLSGPNMAFDGNTNEALVVWTNDENHYSSYPDVQAQRVRADGTLDGPTIDLTPGVSSNKGEAHVVFNSVANEFLVTWGDDRGNQAYSKSLWGQRVGPAGTLLGQPFAISSQPTGATWLNPDLAYNAASNRYLAAWGSGNGSSTQVLGQLIDGSGALVGSNFQIPGPAAGSTQGYPTLAASAHANTFLAVWNDNRTGSNTGSDYGQVFDANGARVGAEIVYHGGATESFFRQIAFNWQTNQYLVAGDDYDEGVDTLVAQRLAEDGTPLGSQFALGGPYEAVDHVAVAYNGRANQYMVGWSGYSQEVHNLYAQRVGGDGSLAGGNVQLTFGTHDQQALAMTYCYAANHVLAAWADNRYGAPPTRFGEPETFDIFGGVF